MKTTIDLPDALLHRAKITAARRRTTLKTLVIEGLEQVLQSPGGPRQPAATMVPEDEDFEIDAAGVPVLRRRGALVTDDFIGKLREAEGI